MKKPTPNPEVEMIPVDAIRVLNPRHRDRKKFMLIVSSIERLGLKKPITVSRRLGVENDPIGYDLVCGQGRLEAFTLLGQTHIPALVVQIPKEERLLQSLVENMARRQETVVSQFRNIEWLHQKGYNHTEIGHKTDLSAPFVGHVLRLLAKGEERLLDAVLKERVPMTIAIEIADAGDGEVQLEMLEGYAQGKLNRGALVMVKRLLEKRKLYGKTLAGDGSRKAGPALTVNGMVAAYQRETDRQRAVIDKAHICEKRLYLIAAAVKRLLADENFVTLLRAENLMTLPASLAVRIG